MNFELTKTERLFRQMIREFAENEGENLWPLKSTKRNVSLWKP